MKNVIFYLMIILCVVSCDVLDVPPTDRLSEDNIWTDEALIELYVTTNYRAVEHGFFQQIWGCAFAGETYVGLEGVNSVLQGNLTSDNITAVDWSDPRMPVGNGKKLNYWSTAYSYIRNINDFFDNITEAPVDETFKEQMIGEMSFMRAFVYSGLIKRYGGVPIIDYTFELNSDYLSGVSRASYDDCVEFISADLDIAIQLLPDRQVGEKFGRVSADAARALKSRVLLYAASPLNNPSNDLAKWQKASDAAEELLDTRYVLHDDYKNLFLSEYVDNDEIIFARYFTQANYHRNNITCGRNGDHGWGNQNSVTQNMVDAYAMTNGELPYLENGQINTSSGYDPQNPYINRDPRFYISILHDGAVWLGRETETWLGGLDSPDSSIESWNASITSYYLNKFIDPNLPPSGANRNDTSPYIFFRYAEILLNYAEAQMELGNDEVARNHLNMVRSRNGVNMPDVTASGPELRAKVQQERRVELAFEGHRYFDVRRWKIAADTENRNLQRMEIIKNDDGSKTYTVKTLLERSFQDSNYLVTIPLSEINKSQGAIEQNPGY